MLPPVPPMAAVWLAVLPCARALTVLPTTARLLPVTDAALVLAHTMPATPESTLAETVVAAEDRFW